MGRTECGVLPASAVVGCALGNVVRNMLDGAQSSRRGNEADHDHGDCPEGNDAEERDIGLHCGWLRHCARRSALRVSYRMGTRRRLGAVCTAPLWTIGAFGRKRVHLSYLPHWQQGRKWLGSNMPAHQRLPTRIQQARQVREGWQLFLLEQQAHQFVVHSDQLIGSFLSLDLTKTLSATARRHQWH